MVFPLLSPRKQNTRYSPDNLQSPNPSSNSPGHRLFDIKSTDSDGRKLNLFRRIFSSRSDENHSPDQSNRLTHRRSSLVPSHYNAMFKKPYIEITRPHPRQEWASHLISIPDNGLKNELINMFTMLANMERRPMNLTMCDIDLFYSWFNVFYSIVDDMFLLEESCLYAWIERTDCLTQEQRKWGTPPDKLTGPLSEAKRCKYKGDILRLANDVRQCQEKFKGRPVLQTLPEMAYAMDVFVSQLLAYLHLKSSHLPDLINQRFNISDRRRFEKHYWTSACRTAFPVYLVVASSAWMNRREQRRWKSRYFLVREKWIFGKWKKLYNRKYQEIGAEFARRVKEAEAELYNHELMNVIVRARAVRRSFEDEMVAVSADDGDRSRTLTSCASCASTIFNQSIASGVHPLICT